MRAVACLRYQGVALENAGGEVADALQRVVTAYTGGLTFRAISQSPWIETGHDTGHIECTTCGSSGIPKVIRRPFITWQKTFDLNRQLFGLTAGDRSAIFGGLNHSLALYGVCESLHLGMECDFVTGMRPRAQVLQLQTAGTTVLYITPTQLRLLTGSGETLPEVRLILCGGGKLDAKTRERAARCCPAATIHEFYGASETSFITLADAETPEGSVGKAYPGVSIEIRGVHQGVGEVWVDSPYLFSGYAAGGSEETRTDGRFMTVGELGFLDPQGHLWLCGRRSRMVTIADKNVYPEAVEALLSQYSDSGLCAVIAAPDASRGHILHAFIQGHPDPQQEKALRRLITEQLGSEMVPRRFWFLPDFPLLSAGKADLKRLEDYLKT